MHSFKNISFYTGVAYFGANFSFAVFAVVEAGQVRFGPTQ
jgi:hypothetical protein